MAFDFRLGERDFAHRGLWSVDGPPENSLAAFEAAAAAGVGAELDVRLSSDGVAMVFHDRFLDRMTPASGALSLHPAAMLADLTLAGTGETIPTLAAVLDTWPRGLPLLIELKADGLPEPSPLAHAVADLLEAWPGQAAVMSFSKAMLEAFTPARCPTGLLMGPPGFAGQSGLTDRLCKAGSDWFDFLGLHTSLLAEAAAVGAGAGGAGPRLAAWTVDRPETLTLARAHADTVIFEGLDPGLVKATRKT